MEFELLKEIIAGVLNVDVKEIKPDTTFVDDLGADSLDLLQITMGIESKFNVTCCDINEEQIKTVDDAYNCIINSINTQKQ